VKENLVKRQKKMIRNAEKSGNMERLEEVARMDNIEPQLSLMALEAAVRVAKKRGDMEKLIALGDLFIAKADFPALSFEDKKFLTEKAMDVYRYAVECEKCSSKPEVVRALGYRLLQLGMYKLALSAFIRYQNTGGKESVMTEITICQGEGKTEVELPDIEIGGNSLISKYEIYGALKSMNADLEKLTSADFEKAVYNLYRRKGHLASCGIRHGADYRRFQVIISERKVSGVVFAEDPEKLPMKQEYVTYYFRDLKDNPLSEEKIVECVNDLIKCNPNVFKRIDHRVIDAPQGATIVLVPVENDGKRDKLSFGGQFGGDVNSGGMVGVEIANCARTGRPLGLDACVLIKRNNITYSQYVEGDFSVKTPRIPGVISGGNRTSFIVGTKYDFTNGSPRELRGGIEERWNENISSQHTVNYNWEGTNQSAGTEHGVFWNKEVWDMQNNPVTPVGGYSVSLGGIAGTPVNYDGSPYYRGSITGTGYMTLLGCRQLVLSGEVTAGTGENLDDNREFRIDPLSDISGRRMLRANAKLGYTLLPKWFPIQIFIFTKAGTTPDYWNRRSIAENSDYKYGAGIALNLPLIGRANLYYDVRTKRFGFSLGSQF